MPWLLQNGAGMNGEGRADVTKSINDIPEDPQIV